MALPTRSQVLIAIAALLTAYAFGRWSAPVKTHTEIKTVEVEKKTENADISQLRKLKTTTIEVDKPDGTKTVTTVTQDDENTNSQIHDTDDTSKSSDTIKDVTYSSSKITLAALGGIPLSFSSVTPVYGGIALKPILGPITVGVWGLSNKTAGMAVGLTF